MERQLNINDCRSILSSEIRGLRRGKTKPSHARQVYSGIGQLFASYRLEMEYYKQSGQKLPEHSLFLPAPRTSKNGKK